MNDQPGLREAMRRVDAGEAGARAIERAVAGAGDLDHIVELAIEETAIALVNRALAIAAARIGKRRIE